jgi:purine-binding chemotaxis protein CheW
MESATSDRFVTCMVGGELYAAPALSVREVVRWTPPTRIPHGAPSTKGVINLRGEIVPLVDLRVHLGLPSVEPTDRTCIIVLSPTSDGRPPHIGLIVDVALEVARVPTQDIESREAVGMIAGTYITGIAHTKHGLLMLLDCQALLRDAAAVSMRAHA